MYYFRKCEKCQTCDGEGYVRGPGWQAFDSWYRERTASTGSPPTNDEVEDYIVEHGLMYESEEIECSDCEGSGVIESEVPLEGVSTQFSKQEDC